MRNDESENQTGPQIFSH